LIEYEVRSSAARSSERETIRGFESKPNVGLKEGIGCMPMDGSCRHGGSLRFEVLTMDGTCQCVDMMIDTEDKVIVGSFG